MGIKMSETTMQTISVQDKVAEVLGDQAEFTPYQVANLCNQLLAFFQVEKEIPTMMAYNYCKNGLIKSHKSTRQTKKGKVVDSVVVNSEDAQAWLTKYVSKNVLALT